MVRVRTPARAPGAAPTHVAAARGESPREPTLAASANATSLDASRQLDSPRQLDTTRQAAVPSVGMTGHIRELVLPGSELELAPFAADAPLTARIVAVRAHGDSFRYDIEYWGFEPGEHDLRACLRRIDGSSSADLPPIQVEIAGLLTAGRVEPHRPSEGALPRLGGYTTWLVAAAVIWIAVLCYALLRARGRRAPALTRAHTRTLAEMLQPLLVRAARGELDRAERARLELGLLQWWQRKLGWTELRRDIALARLREHPEAGPLLRGLENWLHRPNGALAVTADEIAALLQPYRDLPEDGFAVADDRAHSNASGAHARALLSRAAPAVHDARIANSTPSAGAAPRDARSENEAVRP